MVIIFQVIVFFKARQRHLDVPVFRTDIQKIPDQLQHVVIDIKGFGGIDHEFAVFRQVVQRLFDRRLIQKRDFLGQLYRNDFAFMVIFLFKEIGQSQIGAQDVKDTHHQTDGDAFQQIGEDHGDNGDDEGDELVLTTLPHVPEHRRAGQLVTDH